MTIYHVNYSCNVVYLSTFSSCLLLLAIVTSFSNIYTLLNHLQYLEAVDARQIYPKEYTTWREDPSNFSVNGIYPIRKLWETASEAWKEILFTPVRSFDAIHILTD